MITRAEVAKRLGKSVATVRRLEGVVLFPHTRGNGDRLFDEEEVERLRENPTLIRDHGRSKWFGAARARPPRNPRTPPLDVEVILEMVEVLESAPVRSLQRAGLDQDLVERFIEAAEAVRYR